MMQVPTWCTSVGDSGKFQPLSGRASSRTVGRMTTWGCRRISVGLLALVQVVACGGRPRDRVARVARGTRTPPSTLVVRRAESPAPVVLDRGPNPVTIARSLLLGGRWLEA